MYIHVGVCSTYHTPQELEEEQLAQRHEVDEANASTTAAEEEVKVYRQELGDAQVCGCVWGVGGCVKHLGCYTHGAALNHWGQSALLMLVRYGLYRISLCPLPLAKATGD